MKKLLTLSAILFLGVYAAKAESTNPYKFIVGTYFINQSGLSVSNDATEVLDPKTSSTALPFETCTGVFRHRCPDGRIAGYVTYLYDCSSGQIQQLDYHHVADCN